MRDHDARQLAVYKRANGLMGMLDPLSLRFYNTPLRGHLGLDWGGSDASLGPSGRVVMQRTANPFTSVRFRPRPPSIGPA
jgi:hypothetical protein